MVRTDKNGSANNKLVFLSLGLTIVLCAGVSVAIFCLDLKRREEILHLKNQVIVYGEEVIYLKQQLEQHAEAINETATTVHKIKKDKSKPTPAKPKTPAPEEEDENEYYDEYYDYEEDEDEEDDTDTRAVTARTPFVADVDSNDTITDRSKRHVSLEDDKSNILDSEKAVFLDSSLHKMATENIRRAMNPYNFSQTPGSGHVVDLMPVFQATNGFVLRHRNGRNKEKRESEIEALLPNNAVDVAAHFGGDARKYHTGRHKHYDSNNRMYHPSGVFKDWVASDWTDSSYFEFRDGVLKVKASGLYLVYAQIFYADVHDICGYRLYQNEEPVMQCTTMAHSIGGEKRRNTCFSSMILHLRQFNTLTLREIEGNRYTIFEPTKSFFGLVKLKDL